MIMTMCWLLWPKAARAAPCANVWRKKPMPAPPLMMRPFQIGWRRRWRLTCPPIELLAASSTKLCAMAKTRINRPVFMPVMRRARASPRRAKFRARPCLIIILTTLMRRLNWSANLPPMRHRRAPLSNTPIPAASLWARHRRRRLPMRCAAIRSRLLAALSP